MSHDLAWFAVCMIAIVVYFLVALSGAPYWTFCWLLGIPLIFALIVVFPTKRQ